MSGKMIWPKCGSENIHENIVDMDDDDEEFWCGNCHHVGSRKTFTPKAAPEVTESEQEDVPKP